jgi:hypothetical protein
MAAREAVADLQLLEEADLASFKATRAHLPVHLGLLAQPECLLRLPRPRNPEEHQVLLGEESRLLMLPVLELLEVGR